MEVAIYRCGDVEIDATNRRFTRSGREVALEPKLFSLVLKLLATPGMLVTRNDLLDSVWGHRYVTASTLNRLVALARRAFGDDPDQPLFIQTVHGAGYRYIGPFDRNEMAGVDRPARFVPPASVRLPARVEALIGRESELTHLAALFESNRAVTLLGAGGFGKTQCALEAARRLTGRFPDGVWFFDLAPMRTGEEWLQSLGAALSIPPGSCGEMIDRIFPLLQGRRALFVIDNCDRIAAETGTVVIELLRATDELKILATSQAPLQFRGEQLMRMLPLALPELDREGKMSPEALAASPAVQMLLTRIQGVQPGFALSAANGATMGEICRRLDGVPLALELAAARFSLLSPDQVLQRLDQRFRFLSDRAAGRDQRHQNLLAMLDWSFSLLSAEELRLLSWFSVFVRGWTIESAMELAASLDHDPETIVDLVTGLVNKSLVSVASGFLPPRYLLLESVREYALDRLRGAAEEERARDAHLALFVHMTKGARDDMVSGKMRAAVERLTDERENIVTALDYGLASKRGRAGALSIVGSLTLYIKAGGLYSLSDPCRRVVDNTSEIDSADRFRGQLCVGVTAMHQMIKLLAGPYLLAAASGARMHDDRWTEAYANGYYALWLADSGRPNEAMAPAAAAKQMAETLQDALLIGLAGLAQGWILIAQADCAAAVAVLTDVCDLGEDTHQHHFIHMYIGLSQFALGNVSAAAAEWADAMRGAAEVGNVRGMAGSVEGCSYIASRAGDYSAAARFMGIAQRIRERTAVPLFNFWNSHHQSARDTLLAQLGQEDYDRCVAATRDVREEDVFNEVSARLLRYADTLTVSPAI